MLTKAYMTGAVILEQSCLHIPIMVGAYISFSLLKVPDLAIESAYIVGALCAVYMLKSTTMLPAPLALMIVVGASFIGGAFVGGVSSVLTKKGRFPHLLSNLVTFGLFHGINQFFSPVYVSLSNIRNPLTMMMYWPQYPDIVMLVGIAALLVLGVAFILKTQIGYSYAVYGNNPLFFKNYGISTSLVFISGVMIANGLAGVGGYLFVQSNNFLELNMSLGKALLCITSLILGKALVGTKRPIALSIPIVGTFAYFALQQILLKFGFNLKYFTAIQALIVMLVLLYAYRKNPQQLLHDNLGV